jgi:uncharacterized membrane protein
MAQTGQTHRRQEASTGKSGSRNGASPNGRARSGQRKTQSSSNGHKSQGTTSKAGKTQSASNGHKSQSASSKSQGASSKSAKTQAAGNGRKTRSSAAAKRTRASANGRKSTASAAKSRARSSRAPARKSATRAQRAIRKTSRSVRKSTPSLPTPDPRWGIVPLATAGIGGAAWAVARKRRRKRTLADRLDLSAAANLIERELEDMTDVAQAAGRTAGRFAKGAAQSAAPATKRFLRARGKEAKGATKSAGGTTKRFLSRAKDLQHAIPHRRDPSPAARLSRELASKTPARLSRELASKAPSGVEDVWPFGLAVLPVAAYSAARLKAGHRLPIQCAVDVAVPLEVVYDEWMSLAFLPEGTHCVTDIERTDDGLVGEIAGVLGGSDWEAEILDERDGESFAWRSTEGSDCAGLITFHRLDERLTRLELQLDVLPVRSRDAIALVLHTADRRAEADLRRFKARLETMSPDAYGDSRNPDETDQEEEED